MGWCPTCAPSRNLRQCLSPLGPSAPLHLSNDGKCWTLCLQVPFNSYSFHHWGCFQVAFFYSSLQSCARSFQPGLFRIAFPWADQAVISRVEFSLQCFPSLAPHTPARVSTECGPCFLGLLREGSQPVPCAAAALGPHLWASARTITHYLLRHRLAHRASLQAGNNRARNMSWPLCKIKSLFLCEGKYSSLFQKLQI